MLIVKAKFSAFSVNSLKSKPYLARDFDKTKSKFLQRNNIKCIKKPIQGYQISKILKRI
jgi:hypothetical protein